MHHDHVRNLRSPKWKVANVRVYIIHSTDLFSCFLLMLLRFSLIMGHLFRKGSNLSATKRARSILGWHVGATYSFPTDMIVEPMYSEGSNLIATNVQDEYTQHDNSVKSGQQVKNTWQWNIEFSCCFLMLLCFSLIMGHLFRKGSNLQQNVPDEIQVSCNRVCLGLTCGCNLQLSHRHDWRTYVLGGFQLDCNKRTRWVHSTWQQHAKRTKRKNTWQWNTLNFHVVFWCCYVSL